MTTPSVALVLCLIHASVVVTASVAVRFCVARRFAASRVVVGAVGMTCILLVTVLTFLPRPSFWPNVRVSAAPNSEVSDHTRKNFDDASWTPKSAARQSNTAGNASTGVSIPSAWLRRVGVGLHNAIVVTTATPRGGKDLLVVLMLGGIGVGTVRLFLALRAMGRLYRTSAVITDDRVAITVMEFKQRCRCQRTIELRETDELAGAATFGVFKPVILLPAGWPYWSHDELAAVLAHEVAHIHRGDFLQRLIAQLSAAIHFYHPLVRASARWLAADQEFAADRLASGLQLNAQKYVRGLAKLALRFDDSFQDDRAWSNISIMPRSSDSLERRLEMLRTKNNSSSKRAGRLVSVCASISIVLVALATTLLRSATSAAENATANSAPPSESAPPSKTSQGADTTISNIKPGEALFGRAPFDVSIIPHAEDGAFLIRIAELLRIPEVRPLVDKLNRDLTDTLREATNSKDSSIDVREIEWLAGVMQAKVKMLKGKEAKAALMLGAGTVVVRMAHAGNWQ
ncbi:MAG TPA: M56 family metallopeptidase, partial [Pirellulales bacterium]